MALFDRFKGITAGTVIAKHTYPAIPATPEHFQGTGKNAILVPGNPAVPERYGVTVRGTVRSGGKVYTHEYLADDNSIEVGDNWPIKDSPQSSSSSSKS
jgi:hypothetical protein